MQLKVKLRLQALARMVSTLQQKAGEDRVSIIGGHLASASGSKAFQTPARTRPPAHVLDVSRGTPAADIEGLQLLRLTGPSDEHRGQCGTWDIQDKF
ncbi:hypothetical protein BVC80_1653g98 [Macleaya cordata]|uniref:Uncharacterized protein n=1 Tax=Macleaya cordata TaxID=56857 RepID=A0A200PST3_MACCD|nr:hypothetical protein BVC80_1653g98 [Macleaya cordata]